MLAPAFEWIDHRRNHVSGAAAASLIEASVWPPPSVSQRMLAVAQQSRGRPGGGRWIFDLGVDSLGLVVRIDQLLLQHVPKRRVVDVGGHVEVGGAEGPGVLLAGRLEAQGDG